MEGKSRISGLPDSRVYYELKHDDPEAADSFFQAALDHEVIQPFIHFLGTDHFLDEEAILVLSLDDRFSVLACVGWLKNGHSFDANSDLSQSAKTELPSGIVLGGEDVGSSLGIRYYPPDVLREKTHRPGIAVDVVADTVVLTLNITVASLNDTLLRYSASKIESAALADQVKFFIWSPVDVESRMYRSSTLPFDAKSVHGSILALDDERASIERVNKLPKWIRHFRVEICPNNVGLILKTFALSIAAEGQAVGRDLADDGNVRIWHSNAR